LRNIKGRIRQPFGTMRVDANLLPYSFGKNVYDFIPRNRRVLRD
jgi:hypothetical protein